MYTTINFKTKKAVKEAIKNGDEIGVFQPGPFGRGVETGSQTVYLEGPHYPKPHRWYGEGQLEEGNLISIK